MVSVMGFKDKKKDGSYLQVICTIQCNGVQNEIGSIVEA